MTSRFVSSSAARPSFQFWRHLNAQTDLTWCSSRSSLSQRTVDRHFASDTLPDQVVRWVLDAGGLPIKEVLEAGEVFERVRRRIQPEVVVDWGCGHGFAGMLFAMLERRVHQVLLVDHRQPPSMLRLLESLSSHAPWLQEKVRFVARNLKRDSKPLPEGALVLGIHACGELTDRAMDAAIACQGNVALLPCCHAQRSATAPASLQHWLGLEDAADVSRVMRLEGEGYRTHVAWIPEDITPRNRLILGTRAC